MDGSTDKGKVENELFALSYCVIDDTKKEMKAQVRYFQVRRPCTRSDAAGLLDCLQTALKDVGISDLLDQHKVLGVENHPVLVGVATDGAAVNVAAENGVSVE